jgi:murein DD-endopeptidase MepM/ murein hydrolase activator NlpD
MRPSDDLDPAQPGRDLSAWELLGVEPPTPHEPPAVGPAAPGQPLSRRELRQREAVAADPFPLPSSTVAPASELLAGAVPGRGSRGPRGRGSRPGRSPRAAVARARQARASAPNRRPRIVSQLISVGAMLGVAALAIGMSVPANAFFVDVESPLPVAAAKGPGQNLVVAADVETNAADREQWRVSSWAEQLAQQFASTDWSYKVGDGDIRWPFPYSVPISDGYGSRAAPCQGCSTFHNGLDFNPGDGAAIFAMADGKVVVRDTDDWSYGNYMEIESKVDGKVVRALYAHMQKGSSPLKKGDTVEPGDFVGLVGDTGVVTGPHLHFEISVDGAKTDPFDWLEKYSD